MYSLSSGGPFNVHTIRFLYSQHVLPSTPSCLYLLVVIYGASPAKIGDIVRVARLLPLSLALSQSSLRRFHLADDKTS